MRDFHLRFFAERRWPDGMLNLLGDEDALGAVPNTSGAYVLGANSSVSLVYPWGTSPVYYIGQSGDLRTRIEEHRTYFLRAIADHEEKYWWPRYQYGAAHGAYIAWYTCRGRQDPNRLESELVTSFYQTYGSIPITIGTWPTGLRRLMKGDET